MERASYPQSEWRDMSESSIINEAFFPLLKCNILGNGRNNRNIYGFADRFIE